MMKNYLTLILLFFACLADATSGISNISGKPNILLIITDQQSIDAMSCAGNDHLNTPAMDLLAANGIRFTNNYVTQPLCLPFRTSLQTAQYPHEAYALKDRAIKVHLIYSIIIFLFVFFFSDLFARVLKDQRIAYYIKIISIDIVLFGLYKFYAGFQLHKLPVLTDSFRKTLGKYRDDLVVWIIFEKAVIYLLNNPSFRDQIRLLRVQGIDGLRTCHC